MVHTCAFQQVCQASATTEGKGQPHKEGVVMVKEGSRNEEEQGVARRSVACRTNHSSDMSVQYLCAQQYVSGHHG